MLKVFFFFFKKNVILHIKIYLMTGDGEKDNYNLWIKITKLPSIGIINAER